jgi:hypothetical protein
VAGLMVTVAFTISQVVLWRLSQEQKSHLREVTGAYLRRPLRRNSAGNSSGRPVGGI